MPAQEGAGWVVNAPDDLVEIGLRGRRRLVHAQAHAALVRREGGVDGACVEVDVRVDAAAERSKLRRQREPGGS